MPSFADTRSRPQPRSGRQRSRSNISDRPRCQDSPRSRSLTCWSWSRIPAMRTRICRPWKAVATCSGCESPSSRSTGCSAQLTKMCTTMSSRAARRRSGATSVFCYAATPPFGRSLKHALARQNWPDMNAYAAAKTELIGRDPPRVGHPDVPCEVRCVHPPAVVKRIVARLGSPERFTACIGHGPGVDGAWPYRHRTGRARIAPADSSPGYGHESGGWGVFVATEKCG